MHSPHPALRPSTLPSSLHHLHLHPILILPLPHLYATLQCCSRLPAPPCHCRYAASDVFTASKSKSPLISISIFSSVADRFVADSCCAPAVTLHPPFACIELQNTQCILVPPRLTSSYLGP
ncbi:hypothetical protein VZT92_001905 [Zoarces viviparus]|uniref:Uncharacterized protein n=1 Tax=Zoarces viviparus TaxID=48416 RepID=A0AAW1G5C1_ZOAVI